jgi:hypothetical protein
MSTQVTIPARYNGPPNSGNGGYSCGVLAAFIDGPARVRLHAPPPLDTPLELRAAQDCVQAYDGDTLVGSAEPVRYQLTIPPAPSLEQARAAMAGYPCYDGHIFPTCFVCGPGRPHRDGLELFPGPLDGGPLMACVWQPAQDLLGEDGLVRDEVMWSALDCPGYFAAMQGNLRSSVLGQMEGEILRCPEAGEPLVVYCWPEGQEDGRKSYGATAIATAEGEMLASSRSTWIELRG